MAAIDASHTTDSIHDQATSTAASDRTRFAIGAALLALLAACSTSEPNVNCAPGQPNPCTDPNGCAGSQSCNEYGTAYGACQCLPPVDAAAADAMADASAVETSTADSTADALDSSASDGADGSANDAAMTDGSADGTAEE
jgi:hypothetical protein